jgi:hypothetical protein
MLRQTYSGKMGGNATDDMMMRLTDDGTAQQRQKRLTTVEAISGVLSVKFVVRDSLLTACPLEVQHGTFFVSHYLLHAISAMSQLSQRLHATNATLQQSLRYCCNLCDITAIACDKCDIAATIAILQRSHKKTLCLRLSKFLKIHREREAGLKVCPE